MSNKHTDDLYTSVREQIFKRQIVKEDDAMRVLLRLMQQLMTENNVTTVSSPLFIVGDIHGQLSDLIPLFERAGEKVDLLQNNYTKLENKYVFMGDYVDRGYYSLNTFLLLATYKLESGKVTLLRGNHESRQVSRSYGFYNDVMASYGHAGLWNMANEAFDLLPLCSLVDTDVFCVHGGLSDQLTLLERINILNRQDEIPSEGPISDLMWSDPDEKVNSFMKNSRGAGLLFGKNEVLKFNRLNRLIMVCRSHQLAMDGYQLYFGGDGKEWRLATVWSAPDYCYRSGNKASILRINRQMTPNLNDKNNLLVFDKASDRMRPEDNEMPSVSYYFT